MSLLAESWSIAEVAEATGLTAHTLRYYERDGLLLGSVDRTSSGHRRYTDRDLGWIRMVTRLRSTGMAIRDVRQYADLVRAGDGNEAERLELLRAHRDRVRNELREVAAHLDAIEFKIELYEARVGDVATEGEPVPDRARAEDAGGTGDGGPRAGGDVEGAAGTGREDVADGAPVGDPLIRDEARVS